MADADKARPIALPSLGSEVQLGQLYNAYTNTFYDGYSLWSAEQVKKTQLIDYKSLTEFFLSTNDDERNKNAGFDVEESVSLKLALFSVTGSAKYLNETKSHAYEARVGATCRVKTRQRWMPMEQMVNRKYDMVLDNPDFTHFVSKVVEGGQAHVSFTKKCSSSEEETKIKGQLVGALKKFITVQGSLALDKKDALKKELSSCEVKLTCDYDPPNPIVTFADAIEEAAHLPQRLQGKTHTLTVHLLPVHMLDSRASRICRSLDQTDMSDVSAVLDNFQQARLELDYTSKEVVNKNYFPNIYKQVQIVEKQLRDAYIAFKNVCTRILPQLRGARALDETKLKARLRNAIKEADNAVKIAYRFVEAKKKEKRANVFSEEKAEYSQEIYDEALKRGSVTVDRSRVIIAGQDGAGKSCLVDSLLNRPFEKNKASTEGAAVAMTHTATSGWVATDSKGHLDSLIAQGVYLMNQQQSTLEIRRKGSSESSRFVLESRDLDTESEEAEAEEPDSHGSTFTTDDSLEPAHAVEILADDLKTVGMEAKTLTANQQQLVSTFLTNRPSKEDLSKQALGVRDIWDLGGQEVYLATHLALLPDSKAFGLSMYMIVMDISKSLSDEAKSFLRLSDGEVIDQTNELSWIRTNGDFPLYWFGSITAAHEEAPMGDHWLGKDEEVAPPPVFAIGTHRDVLDSNKERFPDSASVAEWLMKQGRQFEQILSDSDFVRHIVVPKKRSMREDNENFREMDHFLGRIFLIDNSVSGSGSPCKGVQEIRQRVDCMTTTHCQKDKKQPLFWVYLELLLFRWSKAMKTVVAKVDEIVKLAQHPTICNISSRDEVLVALKYLANVGAILYFPEVDGLEDVVFTRPMWVISALSAFVTAAEPGPYMMPKWNVMKEKGIMSNDLMKYRLKQMRDAAPSDFATPVDDAGTEQIQDDNKLILRLLQHLDVIAPVAGWPQIEFYVPSMLRKSFLYSHTHWQNHAHSPGLPAPVIVIPIKLKFVPECLYFRLVTRFLNLYPKNPELSRHQCIFLAEDKESPVEGMQL